MRSEETTGDQSAKRPPRTLLLMVLTASLGFEVAAGDGAVSRMAILAAMAWQIALVFSLGKPVRRWSRPSGDLSPIQLPLLLLIGAAPFLLDPLAQLWTGHGRALEVLMLSGFRNVALATAVVALTPSLERTTAALSGFLMLFCVTLGDDPFLYVVLFVFTLAGVVWLMGSYWAMVEGRLADESRRERPLVPFLVLPVLALLAVGLIPHSGRSAIDALPGLLPTSGGTGEFSPTARSGVGDGDMLVAGTKQVQSFAPIEDAPFMDSEEAALYDVFNDLYDEPVRQRNQDRAIALPPQVMQDVHRHLAKSEQAGREFSTLRKQTGNQRSKVGDRTTEALFFVAGRTPLHLRTEIRSIFDGITWYPDDSREEQPPLAIRTINGKPWLDLSQPIDPETCGAAESHALKIARLRTDRIPTPPGVTGIHIDLLDRVDLFDWSDDGQLRMQRKSVPPQSVIHVASCTFDRDRLREVYRPETGGGLRYRHLPHTGHMRQIRRLALQWTSGVPRGWPQIDAVISQLRSHYVPDHTARPPADCVSPVSHFLFTARRGPDYQFATAAAVLLRSLGYSSRVVSGFHADPEQYDARSRHTPVCVDDAHFWVEISVGRNMWIPLEPTPGYELLQPPLGLLARLGASVASAFGWLMSHPVLCLVVVLLSGGVFVTRARLADLLDEWHWRLWRHQSWRSEVLSAVRLLDRRLRRAGWHRPPGATPVSWMRQHAAELPGGSLPELQHVLRLADAAAWASDNAAAEVIAELTRTDDGRQICRCVLCRLGLGELIRHRGRVKGSADRAE